MDGVQYPEPSSYINVVGLASISQPAACPIVNRVRAHAFIAPLNERKKQAIHKNY